MNTLLWFHQSTQLLPSGKVTLTEEVLVWMGATRMFLPSR